LTLGKTEGPGILADNGDILPSKACEALASNFAEGRGEINQVNLIEELVDGDEGGHGFDVVPLFRLAITNRERSQLV
jgi:hypothetical protein